ncbi:MAG: hypothetical protein KA223_04610 [Candidatus Accumulibacter sp.]|nr:hypothetical protein [Accumulibacter sp.]
MTPAQQTALEALVGRTLTAIEIAAIDSQLPERNDVAIAAVLSADRVRVEPRRVGIGTILATMRPNGGAFLDALEQLAATDSDVKWTLELIKQSNFDIGLQATREELTAFAADHPALAHNIAALLTVAEIDDPIHYNAVSDALNVAEGRLTL